MTALFLQHLLLASIGVGALSALGLLLAFAARHDAALRYRILLTTLAAALLVPPTQWAATQAAARWNLRPFETGLLRSAAASWERWRPDFLLPFDAGSEAITSASFFNETNTVSNPATPSTNRRKSVFSTYLFSAYATGTLWILTLWAARRFKTKRLLARCRPFSNEAPTTPLWREIAAAAGLKTGARLLHCEELRTPACCGWLRPTVLLPTDGPAMRDSAALRCALHHEALHLRRRDPLAADLQTLLRALFWFHPLAWLLDRELDRQRELSCDALAARALRKPKTYALALLAFHEPENSRALFSPAGGLTFGGRDARLTLQRRLEMLMYAQTEMNPRRRRLLAGALLAGAIAASAAHLGLAAAFAPAPSLPPQDSAARKKSPEIRVLDTKPNEPKRAEVNAPPGERDGRNVLEQMRRHNQPADGICTDQETVASAANAELRDNTLTADEILLSLPEGSQLRATFEGQNVTLQQAGDAANLMIRDGSVRITDVDNVVRLTARPAAGQGTLEITTKIENGEVAMKLRCSAEGGQAGRVRLETNLNAGVPAGETQPPHGAIRWKLNPGGEGKPNRVKMQWIYDMAQVRRAVEERAKQGGAVKP